MRKRQNGKRIKGQKYKITKQGQMDKREKRKKRQKDIMTKGQKDRRNKGQKKK